MVLLRPIECTRLIGHKSVWFDAISKSAKLYFERDRDPRRYSRRMAVFGPVVFRRRSPLVISTKGTLTRQEWRSVADSAFWESQFAGSRDCDGAAFVVGFLNRR